MTTFARVAQLAEEMAATASRLKKRAAIAQAIASVHAAAPQTNDAGLFALYLAGSPFAESDPRNLNAGAALLSRAVLAVSGATDAELTAAYRRHGDLGAAAFDLLQELPAKAASLTLTEVAEAFAAIAAARTTAARAALVESLLHRSTPLEAKYLLKLMLGDMRIGVKQSLVEEAIAVAASGAPSQTASSSAVGSSRTTIPAQVRDAVMLEADLAAAVRRAFAGTLADARMRLFHPLGFMLASPVGSPEEAATRFATASDSPNGERTTENGQRIHAFSKTSTTACAPNSTAAIPTSRAESPSIPATATTSPPASRNSPKPSPPSIRPPMAPSFSTAKSSAGTSAHRKSGCPILATASPSLRWECHQRIWGCPTPFPSRSWASASAANASPTKCAPAFPWSSWPSTSSTPAANSR